MTKTQYEQLVEEFPEEVLRTLPKAGGLTYVPVAEVITRLNNVLGVGGWGYSVRGLYHDDEKPNWIIAIVDLTAIVDGMSAARSGVGGYDTSNKGMDLADAHKSATSEALKKAAQALGVGLHLSRKEEAIAMDAMADRADPKSLDAFKAKMASRDDEFKAAVKEYASLADINWKRVSADDLADLVLFATEYAAGNTDD